MSDPLISLLTALVVGAAAWAVFRPTAGWFWVWIRARSRDERTWIEDALKHIHEREYAGRRASLESIAGVLGVPTGSASELVDRLIARGHVESGEQGYELTPEGRSYALQVIRAHRLWERYLADETDVQEADLHALAEQVEHRLSPTEADELDARLGHPTHDPHGDPIPTADGDIAAKDGLPLTRWSLDEPGRIVHLEDEPPAVFAQLLAEGLRLGMDIRVEERTPARLRCYTEDREFMLAAVVAENITVAPLPEEAALTGPFRRLSELPDGETGVVLGIDEACRGLTRRRFMDLGLTPGSRIRAERVAPFGEPRAYLIRETLIALRREQAAQILLETPPSTPGGPR
jgi:DtxR family Mn-dependent transcriptional regulator